ncbi:MAG: outer membrane lipoprotein LolB [Proteobacteria bacterium]|nr:outer membrane lipoprotein LolB [Pseudomonadota bacterium]
MFTRIFIATCLIFLVGCSQQPIKVDDAMPSKHKPEAQQQQPQESKESNETKQSKDTKLSKNTKQSKQSKQLQKQLTSNHWQAEGRIAASNGKKGGNASFVWTQKGDFYQIKLFGPFGSGSLSITGNARYVELHEANGKITKAKSPDQLLKKVAGLQVPVNGLRYWLRGVASPASAINNQQLDNAGYLRHLVQQGWHIDYESFHKESSPFLPHKLRLQNGPIKLKLVITRWKRIGA